MVGLNFNMVWKSTFLFNEPQYKVKLNGRFNLCIKQWFLWPMNTKQY